MKVKYLGNRGLYYNYLDWNVGDVKEVAQDLFFPENMFEVLDTETQSAIEMKPKKGKTKSL